MGSMLRNIGVNHADCDTCWRCSHNIPYWFYCWLLYWGRKMKRRLNRRRSSAEIKADLYDNYRKIESAETTGSAMADFHRPVYQAAKLIEKQGEYLNESPDE